MDFNFNFVGLVDVVSLKNNVIQLSDKIWEEHQFRQKAAKTHQKTKTIELMWDLDSLNSLEKGRITKNFQLLDIPSFLKKIKNIYELKFGSGEFVRVLIVKLEKKSKIAPHVDSGIGLIMARRTHIPIITNTNVIFIVGGEEKNMKEGEIWEIDNQSVHSVENNSDIDRIHLIIDYLPNIVKRSLI